MSCYNSSIIIQLTVCMIFMTLFLCKKHLLSPSAPTLSWESNHQSNGTAASNRRGHTLYMGFHCGYNADYQYRKPSRALGQEDILPSIPTRNLLTKGWQQLHQQAIGSPYMGGQDFFLPQAPLRGFLHPEARLEGNMGHLHIAERGLHGGEVILWPFLAKPK